MPFKVSKMSLHCFSVAIDRIDIQSSSLHTYLYTCISLLILPHSAILSECDIVDVTPRNPKHWHIGTLASQAITFPLLDICNTKTFSALSRAGRP
jgi:hypothetical protein